MGCSLVGMVRSVQSMFFTWSSSTHLPVNADGDASFTDNIICIVTV